MTTSTEKIREKADAPESPGTGSTARAWLTRVVLVGLLVVCVGVMFLDVADPVVGLAAIALLLVLMFMKVPVGAALGLPGVVGLYALRGDLAAANALGAVPFEAVAQWTLSVLPMFIFMGLLLERSGITTDIYGAASRWLSWLPGGVGVATNAAGAGLAAVSGSSLATTYALGRAGIPEMLGRGYDRRVAVGSVAVASLAGHLIPPSMMLVIYAGIAQVPIGPQLLAGIGPGVLIVLCSAALITVLGTLRPRLVGRGAEQEGAAERSVDWADRWRSLARIWPLPILVAIVLGGMYSGTFTATEAGAAGALGALVLALWFKRRSKPVGVVGAAAGQAAQTTGAIFLLIIGATLLTRLLTVTGITTGFSEWVADVGLTRIQFLIVMVIGYLIMGMFMDSLAMMLLTVPFLIPTLELLQVDLLWFGVFTVLLAEVAMLTPPIGMLSYVIHGLTQEPAVNKGRTITLGQVFAAVLMFFPAIVLAVVLLVVFPEIATWIPGTMK